jgi:hypothetical protein
MEFEIVLVTDPLGRIAQRILGSRPIVGLPQKASCTMYDKQEIDNRDNKLED